MPTALPLPPSSTAVVEITDRERLMQAARTALADLLADVVAVDQSGVVIDLLNYDCDFDARNWIKLARYCLEQSADINAEEANDRRTRRAESGWRDA